MAPTNLSNNGGLCCADFRSDTVTRPDDEMRKVMAEAVVGDDVYLEDPTVNELEKTCATLLGKEAGLFVASGTMGNLLSIMASTQRGDEIIVGKTSHIHRWEQGNYASLTGISATTVNVLEDGTLPIEEIEAAIRQDDIHMPRTKVICLENTHNYAGGKPISLEYMKEVRKIADANGLLVHVDGARFFSAAVALNLSIGELAEPADSVMMCFSKNLGAPVGSIIVGRNDFIMRCRRLRKSLGGGWRQAGILAAAALYALKNAEVTVRRDHENAKFMEEEINAATPKPLKGSLYAIASTNMVVFHILVPKLGQELYNFLKENGVFAMLMDETRIRFVLHKDLTKEHIGVFIKIYKKFLIHNAKFIGSIEEHSLINI